MFEPHEGDLDVLKDPRGIFPSFLKAVDWNAGTVIDEDHQVVADVLDAEAKR